MRVVVAITGASGSIYAKQLMEDLIESSQVSRVYVVLTDTAKEVIDYELKEEWQISEIENGEKVELLSNQDMFVSIASGSAAADAMVIVPCSMGMIGRIANGISNDLISRAADVMMKERRRLIVVPRETPMSIIHLQNMMALTSAGAVVLPATPSFYHHPKTIDELIVSVTDRILQQLGIDKQKSYHWQNG